MPEDEYARLYEKLSSSDSEQVEEAMSSLRRIKALEEAEVEAHERGQERTGPGDIQDLSGRISKDLSEPIFFHSRGERVRGGSIDGHEPEPRHLPADPRWNR